MSPRWTSHKTSVKLYSKSLPPVVQTPGGAVSTWAHRSGAASRPACRTRGAWSNPLPLAQRHKPRQSGEFAWPANRRWSARGAINEFWYSLVVVNKIGLAGTWRARADYLRRGAPHQRASPKTQRELTLLALGSG